jgi:hypothetical protein
MNPSKTALLAILFFGIAVSISHPKANAQQYVPNVNSCITVTTLGTGIVLWDFHNNCSTPVIFYVFSEDGRIDSDTIVAHSHHAGLLASSAYKFFACPYSPQKTKPVETGTGNFVSYKTEKFQCMVLNN